MNQQLINEDFYRYNVFLARTSSLAFGCSIPSSIEAYYLGKDTIGGNLGIVKRNCCNCWKEDCRAFIVTAKLLNFGMAKFCSIECLDDFIEQYNLKVQWSLK